MFRGFRRTVLAASLVAGAIALLPASAFALDTIIDSGPDNGTTIHTATATFTFSSPGSTPSFECAVDTTVNYTDCASPFTTPSLSNGDHTFSVRVKDDGGGTGPGAPASRKFTVDATPPTVTTVKPVVVTTTTGALQCASTHLSLAHVAGKKKDRSYCGGRFAIDLDLSCPASTSGGWNCEGSILLDWIQPSWDNPKSKIAATRFSIPSGQTQTVRVGINEPLPFTRLHVTRKAKRAAKKAAAAAVVTQTGVAGQTVTIGVSHVR